MRDKTYIQPMATTHEVKRELSAVGVAMMGLGSALGTGLFLGSRDAIGVAGAAVIVSYLIATLMALAVVYAMGEITVVHPYSGGFGDSARHFVGPRAGFMARWNVAVSSCIAIGAEITAASGYIVTLSHGLPMIVPAAVISIVLLLLGMMPVRSYGMVQSYMTFLKIGVVVLFIIVGLGTLWFGIGMPGGKPVGLSTLAGEPFLPHGITGLLQGVSVAVFSFGGIESSSVAAGECKNPSQTVPRATMIMLATLLVADVGSLFTILGLSPVASLLASDPHQSPFVTVLKAFGVPGASGIMNILLILAAFSAALGLMYAASRMLLSLAKESLAPNALSHVRPNGVPNRAVWAAASGMLVAVLASAFSPDRAFVLLLGVLVFGVVVTWSLVLITHICMRVNQRETSTLSRMRLPGGIWTSSVLLGLMPLIALSLWWIQGMRFALIVGIPYVIGLFIVATIVTRRRVS